MKTCLLVREDGWTGLGFEAFVCSLGPPVRALWWDQRGMGFWLVSVSRRSCLEEVEEKHWGGGRKYKSFLKMTGRRKELRGRRWSGVTVTCIRELEGGGGGGVIVSSVCRRSFKTSGVLCFYLKLFTQASAFCFCWIKEENVGKETRDEGESRRKRNVEGSSWNVKKLPLRERKAHVSV